MSKVKDYADPLKKAKELGVKIPEGGIVESATKSGGVIQIVVRLSPEKTEETRVDKHGKWVERKFNGVVHSDDGEPSGFLYRINGSYREVWHKNGKEHRDGDLPAVLERKDDGRISGQTWKQDGLEHRLGNPSSTQQDSREYWEHWSIKGNSHRENGPSNLSVYADGTVHQHFSREGKTFREDGKPTKAFFYPNGKPEYLEWVTETKQTTDYTRDGKPYRVNFYDNGQVKGEIWSDKNGYTVKARKYYDDGSVQEKQGVGEEWLYFNKGEDFSCTPYEKAEDYSQWTSKSPTVVDNDPKQAALKQAIFTPSPKASKIDHSECSKPGCSESVTRNGSTFTRACSNHGGGK